MRRSLADRIAPNLTMSWVAIRGVPGYEWCVGIGAGSSRCGGHPMQSIKWSTSRRFALLAALVISLTAGTASAATAAVDPLPPAPAGQDQTWIVTLAGNADAPREAPQLVQREGGRLLAAYTHVLDGFAFAGSAQAAAALARDPRVAH